PIEKWGHEYVRHLAMEIGAELRSGTSTRKESIEKIIVQIVTYNLKHNAEVEACDLLLEIERLDVLLEHIKKEEHERACLYLLSSAPLSPDPDNTNMIKTAMQIYAKFGKELEALRCAVMLNDPALINKLFNSNDNLVLKQMAILLGRHQIFVDNAKLPDGIHDLNNNSHLSKFFRILARELDIMEP
uniref:RPN1 N-terminal domain-containing protein n=1 Tax=Panagrolaimus sp. PS1159 TaxID=55785 RepID=A0AC35FFD8_9BILA